MPFLLAEARKYVRIVGSSAIFPFLISVAENMQLKTGLKSPVIEATGTGGGIKIFCSGTGKRTPDLVAASRPMTDNERAYCASKGVHKILEIVVGYDGIVLGSAVPARLDGLSRSQLHLILADQLKIGTELYKNSLTLWSDLSPEYPRQKIKILGPGAASGTKGAFLHHIFRKWDREVSLTPSLRLRRDGVYVDASDQETVIIQKLQLEPHAFGIFSFNFLALNRDKVHPVPIDGVFPGVRTIADGSYPLSRPLYLYAKGGHFGKVPGLEHFLFEFLSEDASGPQGYLSTYGFIPLSEKRRSEECLKIERALS